MLEDLHEFIFRLQVTDYYTHAQIMLTILDSILNIIRGTYI